MESMIKAGVMEIGLTALFQIMNLAIIIGIGFAIYNILVKLPKRLRANEERIKRIEKRVEEISKKMDEKFK